jgi:hypothetical protein
MQITSTIYTIPTAVEQTHTVPHTAADVLWCAVLLFPGRKPVARGIMRGLMHGGA